MSYDYNIKSGKPPSTGSTGLRGRARQLGRRITTPVGTTGLAVLAFVAGSWVGQETGFLGGQLSEARSALDARTGELREAEGELAIREIEMDRLERIQDFSARHDIPADLAASVYDIALSEGLRPELAFRMVETESSFRRNAVSEAGAVGYTQIKPSTATWLKPGLTHEELFRTETNLRLGFRYFSFLMDRYEGDEKLALLAYNRGPSRVGSLLALGEDPSNGYARQILTGME